MDADINAVINQNGATALIQASYEGNKDRVNHLIEAGADLNSQDKAGNTPLMRAALQGHNDIVIALIDANAKLDLQSNNGNTALMRAAEKGHTDILILLIKAGANLDLQNNFGMTALMTAVKICQLMSKKDINMMPLITTLIQAWANCDLINNYGSSLTVIANKYSPENTPAIEALLRLQIQSKMFDVLKSFVPDEPIIDTDPTFLDLPMELKTLILSHCDYPEWYQPRVENDLSLMSKMINEIKRDRSEAEEKREYKATI